MIFQIRVRWENWQVNAKQTKVTFVNTSSKKGENFTTDNNGRILYASPGLSVSKCEAVYNKMLKVLEKNPSMLEDLEREFGDPIEKIRAELTNAYFDLNVLMDHIVELEVRLRLISGEEE